MRKKVFTFFIALVVLFGAGVLYFDACLSAAVPGSKDRVDFSIPAGASSSHIAQSLEENGLIRNWKVFVYYARFVGSDTGLKSGEYALSPADSVPEIIDLLVHGGKDGTIFTIPEGYTARQVGDLLEEKQLVNRDEFDHLLAGGEFEYSFIKGLDNLPDRSARLEGYLFPDTYQVGGDFSGAQIIDLMLNRFEEVLAELDFSQRAEEKGLSLNEGITMASMIEREVKVDEERPLIAGVIYNRLRLGMPLQIDATVQYALKEHRPVIYYKDLEVDSPYNTYKISGFPPGPIGMPGKKSLQAVLEPAATECLYYVAKPDGSHAFSKTLQEHEANIKKYQ